MKICDSLTILRDGVLTAELSKDEFEEEKIKQLMIGREMSAHYYREDEKESYQEEAALETKNLCCQSLKDIDVVLQMCIRDRI